MVDSTYLDQFIDIISTEFGASKPCCTAKFIAGYCAESMDGIESIIDLDGGCTNSSVLVKFFDSTTIKLTVFLNDESPYKINVNDEFLNERTIKNNLYKDEFKILYNANPSITISEYIPGKSLDKIIPDLIKNKEFEELSNLNSKVVHRLSDFHNFNEIKTHNTTIVSIAMIFFSALKELLRHSIYFDSNLRDNNYINKIHNGIEQILLFESGFDDDDFVLSHLDTDPVNILSIDYDSENAVELIDFEFTGVGLKYYDYVNYLNALDFLHLSNCTTEEKFIIHRNFVSICQNVIPEFNYEDFKESYKVMRFVWGIWYLMYGLKNESEKYINIGKEWVSDWISS